MVENILPNKWRCKDTLYVVVGCYYGDDSWVLKDACDWGNTSYKSKECVMPTARYKIVKDRLYRKAYLGVFGG